MSTNSYIGVQKEDGTVRYVYCHWNGYPGHQGPILLESYPDLERATQLIELGDLSALGSRVDPDPNRPHSYDAPQKGVCVFYGRDRGEEGQGPCEVPAHGMPYNAYAYMLTHKGVWVVRAPRSASSGTTPPWLPLAQHAEVTP